MPQNPTISPLQKVIHQFLGNVDMVLAKYDLPAKPTNIGMFCLGFPRVDRLRGDTCSYVCPQTGLN